MGVGTNILGYANPKIDNQVIKSIKNSNMSTLNSKYEIFLAEKLIEIHKWADMARFARTGGEANSIAIRLARAFTKRQYSCMRIPWMARLVSFIKFNK